MTGVLNRTILVVDDDDDVRESIAELLEHHGYTVVQQRDGRQAEQYLTSNAPPACLILDLMMPRLDGWALAALMRQGRLPQVPLIVITAAGDRWGYPAPAERLLKKPLDVDRLMSMVTVTAGPP
jgi:CheY-like chemotaxis protein